MDFIRQTPVRGGGGEQLYGAERTKHVRQHLKEDFRKRKKLWHNKIKKRGEAKAGVKPSRDPSMDEMPEASRRRRDAHGGPFALSRAAAGPACVLGPGADSGASRASLGQPGRARPAGPPCRPGAPSNRRPMI